MGVDLANSEQAFMPETPETLKSVSEDLYEYLERMKRFLDQMSDGTFNNDTLLANAINSGTSGTFAITSGSSIVVTSGIVTSVTT